MAGAWELQSGPHPGTNHAARAHRPDHVVPTGTAAAILLGPVN